jgi:hypothetical protein
MKKPLLFPFLQKLLVEHFQRIVNIKNILAYLGLFFLNTGISFGQYVHPNQAGRKGGDTGVGIGNQVVTSTYYGNAGNIVAQGVIMSVNKDGTNASSFHDFDGYPGDGSYPWYTTPHQASNGKLYGSTFLGGTSNWGTVYDYDFATCSENVIYNSGPGPSGGSPANYANINELSDGKIYSIQTYGGTQGGGQLIRMNKDGSGLEVIHNFHESNSVAYTTAASNASATAGQPVMGPFSSKDGMWPYAFVVEGPDGKIYGTTLDGGSWSWGAVYRCNKDGSNYEVIYSGDPTVRLSYYKKTDGTIASVTEDIQYFWGNVAFDATGKLYFNGFYGNYLDLGGCARIDADGSNYQVVHAPQTAADGYAPYRGPLIIDNQVFGTYRFGGGGAGGIGVAWSVNTDGTNYTKLKIFETVSGSYADGYEPWAGLSYDGTYLFGTTIVGGGPGVVGTIFKVKPDGTGFQTIHRFANTQAIPTCGAGKTGMWTYYPSAERVTFANVGLGCSKTCTLNPAPCTASATAPTVSSSSITNNCPLKSANLNSIITGTNITWHTGTPATLNNQVSDPTSVLAGTYYATYYDATNNCFSTSSSVAVTVTINAICSQTILLSAGLGSGGTGLFTTPVDIAKTGNAATELSPSGGKAPFIYSTVLCADGSASTATTQGGTIIVNASTGAYTYTPASGYTGLDTFCIKVCDSTSPTANCTTATYTITVTPKACVAKGSAPN